MSITSSNQVMTSKRLSLKRFYKIPQDYKIIKVITIICGIIILLSIPSLYQKQQFQNQSLNDIGFMPKGFLINEQVKGTSQFSIYTQNYISNYCKQDNQNCDKDDLNNINSVLILIQSFKSSNLNKKSRAKQEIQTSQGKQHQEKYQKQREQYQQNQNNQNQQHQKQNHYNQKDQFKKIKDLEEIKLFVIKNSKMTTPIIKQSTLLSFMISKIFYENRYEDIDLILTQNQNSIVWQTNKKISMLSLRSNAFISPSIIQLEIITDNQQELSLLGLTYGPLNEIIGVNLGKYILKNGINRIQCSKQYCREKYPIIMMVITNIRIKRVKIYVQKQ